MNDAIRVLILEDRNDDAEIMVLALESDGFEVAWERVETPDSLIARLAPDIDVILADYTLPQFTASDALVLLQQHEIDIPLIVVTGSVSEEIAVACIKHGAADYLLKDRLSRLGEAVRFAMRQHDLRRAQRQAELDLIVLRQAVESSINAVVMTDTQGRIVFANDAVMSLWAIPAHQTIIGEPLLHYLGHSVEANALFTRLQQETTLQGELSSVTQDNRALTLQYAANQVPDSSGQFRNFLFIFVDITEQKRSEGLRVELERERELRELRSRFVSMLVHDFRNPLTALQVNLSMIERYHESLTPDAILERIHAALYQSKHLNRLIDDVLMIGKMEHLSSLFAPQQLDIVAFCSATFEAFASERETTNHELVFACDLPPLIYPIDPKLLQRAITNLLSNAVKYSPDGGMVKCSLWQSPSEIGISIADNGIGIPAADQKRIFDGFHRASNVGSIEGTGLGLAIVKQVIEIHGGTIACESAFGQGSTFIIRLPPPQS